MRHTFVGICVVMATIAGARRTEAQPMRHGSETRATGCLERGSTPRSFLLRGQGTPAAQASASITLVAPGTVDLSPYIGQKVQVSGVMPGSAPHERSAAAATRIIVRDVQLVAGPCSAALAAPGSSISTPGATSPAAASGPAPASTPTPPSSATTTTTTGASDQTGVTGDALLDGLVNFNIQQLLVSIQLITNVQDTVINVTDVLNDFQIQALLQLLNSNPVASLNATELSLALQQSGVLAPGETVVGVSPPAIRDNKTLTQSLQQQGILQPGERVVGTQGARVYKMKN